MHCLNHPRGELMIPKPFFWSCFIGHIGSIHILCSFATLVLIPNLIITKIKIIIIIEMIIFIIIIIIIIR